MLSSLLSIALFAAAAAAQPAAVRPKVQAAIIRPLITTVNITATPATITFTATNPAITPDAGSQSAVVQWSGYNGTHPNPWNLTVSGGSATFGSCLTVPISAVTVTCTSTTLVGGGTGTAVCGAPFALSTGATAVAGGVQNGSTATYTINLTFSLADNWKYIATNGQTCSLTLTYTANLN